MASKKQEDFTPMVAFANAMQVPILDLSVAASLQNKFFTITQLNTKILAESIQLANDGDNRVVTADGANGLNAESALTFDGSALVIPDGSAALPSLTFPGGGTDTGIYSAAADTVSMAVSETQVFNVNSSLFNVVGVDLRVLFDVSNYLNISIGASGDATFALTGTTPQFTFDQDVGIGGVTPTSTLHVDQASGTGAIPVLTLDQADVSEEILEVISVAGVGNAIELVGAKTLTTTLFLKATINGATVYSQWGTIA